MAKDPRDKAPRSHAHVWVAEETLTTTDGIPYEVGRETCRECGEVRKQHKKRLVA